MFEVLLPDGAHKYGMAKELEIDGDGHAARPDRAGPGGGDRLRPDRAKDGGRPALSYAPAATHLSWAAPGVKEDGAQVPLRP